jgi:hypothetical protein
VWVGTRGSDAKPLVSLTGSLHVYSAIDPFTTSDGKLGITLEQLQGRRPDLDLYDFDLDSSLANRRFWRSVSSAIREPSLVVPYRPSYRLSSVVDKRRDSVRYLGLSRSSHASFESKTWVERQLAACGIPTIPSLYVCHRHQSRIRELLKNGPVVIRENTSSGGTGVHLIQHESELSSLPAPVFTRPVAVSPYIRSAIPVNAAGCVFPDGQTTLHPPSVQLIGIPGCSERSFGYCGNDFGAVQELDQTQLRAFETIILRVGRWLRSNGYIGAFGVDGLVDGGTVILAEVNPRFQGSSRLSAEICDQLDVPNIHLDHMAAFLGLSPMPGLSLREFCSQQPSLAQLVCHRGQRSGSYGPSHSPEPLSSGLSSRLPELVDLLPSTGIRVDVGAICCRLTVPRAVTSSGTSLFPWEARLVRTATWRLTTPGSSRLESTPTTLPG